MTKINFNSTIANTPQNHKIIISKFQQFLTIQPTKTGVMRNSTIHKNLIVVRRLIEKFDFIKEITAQDVQTHIITYKTRGKMLGIFKRFFNFAYKEKLITKRTLNEILALEIENIISYSQDLQDEIKWSIPQSRWIDIYRSIPAGHNSFLFGIWLGFNFALRRAEIVHLNIIDSFHLYDRKDSYLHIKPVLDIDGDLWETKTPSSIRKLYISNNQEIEIYKFLDNREKVFREYFPKIKHNFLIYSNWNGMPIKPGTLRDWCSTIEIPFYENEKEIIKTLKPHVLRYSSAVHLYNSKKDLYAVSKFLGHTNIRTTELYLALTQAQQFEVIKSLVIDSGL